MVIHTCPTCKKEFNKKSHYVYHIENKKYPCIKYTESTAPKDSNNVLANQNILNDNNNKTLLESNAPKDSNNVSAGQNILNNNNSDKTICCIYCNKIFTRNNNLQRHLNDNRCKSKKNFDELEKLKEDMKIFIVNYQEIKNNYINLEKENEILKQEILNLKKENTAFKNFNSVKNIDNNNTSSKITILDQYQTNIEPSNKDDLRKIKQRAKRENIPRTLRYAVWEKSFGKNNEAKCVCCKNNTIAITNFECGHIISNKDGGKICIDNLKPICKTCNTSMGTTNMDIFMKKYGL